MESDAPIRKVLVVLSPDLVKPDSPFESALLRRACDLAEKTGCALELFHVCHDNSLADQLFSTESLREQKQVSLSDHDATLLAELATRMKEKGVKVDFQVRWDSPRTDAILRKIAQSRPDLVMKQAREHNFVIGITSNTDWELARRSPAHLWLVHDKADAIKRIVAAVGNTRADDSDITTAADYDLFRTARQIADSFEADIYPVNAYQTASTDAYLASASGMGVVADMSSEAEQSKEVLVKRHTSAVRALANYFHIDRDRVQICEGQPNEVIPQVSHAIEADMIVMGARNIGRWERMMSAVTVEPVMAETACDIVIVRESARSGIPEVKSRPFYGMPKYDLEAAITNPRDTFESPQEVANADEISFDLKRRILQAWEYDIRAQMNEENEGGPVTRSIDVGALDDIREASGILQQQRKDGNKEDARLVRAS